MTNFSNDDDFMSSQLSFDEFFKLPLMEGLLRRIEDSSLECDRRVSYIFESVAASEMREISSQSDLKSEDQQGTTQSKETANSPAQVEIDYSNDILQYNVSLAAESKKGNAKRTPSKRLLDQFLIKLKKALKHYVADRNPRVDTKLLDKELNNLPAMRKCKSLREFRSLFKTGSVYGVPVNIPELAISYLCSGESLIDGIFPRQNKDGHYSKKRCKLKTAEEYPFFLPTYELMSRLFDESEDLSVGESYQNVWYYAQTTPRKYNEFQLDK